MELRAEIQASQESVRVLAKRLGVNPKSIQRWRRRRSTLERAPGRPAAGSSVLSPEDQAIILAFRQTTRLALDDCLYALQPTLPHLRRSTLHRCLQRHGLSRLTSNAFPAGFRTGRSGGAHGLGQVAVVVSPALTEEGMFYLFGATDRLTRLACARLSASDQAADAVDFLAALAADLPYRLDAILTNDSPAFAWPPQDAGDGARPRHPFTAACDAANITHIVTPRIRPGPAPDLIHRFKYRSRQDLQNRLTDFLIAVNYGQRLKTLGGQTPFEMISRIWRHDPTLFSRAPVRPDPSPPAPEAARTLTTPERRATQ
jgi:hypothetical protein